MGNSKPKLSVEEENVRKEVIEHYIGMTYEIFYNKQLYFDFNEIIKNGLSNPDNEKCEIKFSDIIENEKFRSLINLNDFKTEDLSDKNDEEEKEIHEVEKIEYGTNDYEDGEEEIENKKVDLDNKKKEQEKLINEEKEINEKFEKIKSEYGQNLKEEEIKKEKLEIENE